MMYLEYDKCPERTIKKTRVAYVIISSACTEYVRKFDEWNRSILVTWTLVFWRANYLKLSSRRCKVVFAGCHDGVIEQKVSANPLMRRNPDTSRPCYTAPRPRGSTGEVRIPTHAELLPALRELSLCKRAGARPKTLHCSKHLNYLKKSENDLLCNVSINSTVFDLMFHRTIKHSEILSLQNWILFLSSLACLVFSVFL